MKMQMKAVGYVEDAEVAAKSRFLASLGMTICWGTRNDNAENYSGGRGRPGMFQERWCTALPVARMAERPGANARPTSPWPATSRLARPSGAILTMPRVPESDAAT